MKIICLFLNICAFLSCLPIDASKITQEEYLSGDENLSNIDVFSYVYENGVWDVDNLGNPSEKKAWTSGSGSSLKNVKPYLVFLEDFLKEKQIKTVVDLGCGDWQFSKTIDWKDIQYKGFDVVEGVIQQNQKLYGKKNISFIHADATSYDLPAADLLICKEVLQHLPFKDIFSILSQIKKYKYCLILNDVDPITLSQVNSDIRRGHYRALDLTQAPFYLKGRKVLSYASGIETKQLLLIDNTQP